MPKEGAPLYRREVAPLSGAGSCGSLASWDMAGRHHAQHTEPGYPWAGPPQVWALMLINCVMLGWQFKSPSFWLLICKWEEPYFTRFLWGLNEITFKVPGIKPGTWKAYNRWPRAPLPIHMKPSLSPESHTHSLIASHSPDVTIQSHSLSFSIQAL